MINALQIRRHVTGRSIAESSIWAAAFAFVAMAQLLAGSAAVHPYDEALTLYGGSRVAHGELPYRDFWSLYGPGSFYALAVLDRLFGESVLVGRIFDASSRAAIVLLVFVLVTRRVNSFVSWVAGGATFLLLVGVREYLFPALPATALALLCMLALRRAMSLSEAEPFRLEAAAWVAPGAAAGATLLFRHDFGTCAMLACLWGWSRVARTSADGWRPAARTLAALLFGFALVAGPPLAALLSSVPATLVYENLILIPLRVYVEQRALPFPLPIAAWQQALAEHSPMPLLSFAGVWLPPIVGAVAIGLAVRRAVAGTAARAPSPVSASFFESLLVLQLFLCFKGSVRVQVLHMLPAMIVSVVLIAQVVDGAKWRLPAQWRTAVVGLALLAAAGVGLNRARAWSTESVAGPLALRLADWRSCVDAKVSRLGCFVVGLDHVAVVNFLREHARPGDTMYVGAGRHDKLFVNSVDLYFLSGLPAATRWHDLHPGVQTMRAVQAEMIDQLTRRPPAFVVIDTAWDAWREPNASRLSSGVTVLDEYLRAHYVPVYAAGTLTVSVPKNKAAR